MRPYAAMFGVSSALLMLLSCGGGGSSTPNPTPNPNPAPPGGGSSNAPSITGVGPSPVIAAPMSSFLTVTGTNLIAVDTVMVTPPGGATVTATRDATQIRFGTATSFMLIVPVPVAGTYTFQARDSQGQSSNVFSLSVGAPVWVDEGERLAPAAFTPNNGQIADDSVVRLQDGRWRMYVQVGSTTRTATSTDGLAFTAEQSPVISSGARTPDGITLFATHPRAVVLEDGRVRLFVLGLPTGIHSALCAREGVPCELEAGERVNAGGHVLSGPGIVRLRDGRWRMYFGAKAPGSGEETERVLSAVSSDMLTWSLEPGSRIGPGAATLTGNAIHPSVLANDNGSVTIFYKRVGRDTEVARDGIWTSTSADGLAFTTETRLFGLQIEANGSSGVGDPDAVRLPDGRVRLYMSWTSGPPSGSLDTFRIRSYIGRIEASAAMQTLTRLLGESRRSGPRRDPEGVRELTDAAIDAMAPLRIPAVHSVRDRIARAEHAYRTGQARAIVVRRAVESFNALADSVSAPAWARTNVDQVQARRIALSPQLRGLIGTAPEPSSDLTPLEAVVVGLSLARLKMEDPDYQVDPDEWARSQRGVSMRSGSTSLFRQWRATTQDLLLVRPAQMAVEKGLSDERQEASWRAHMFLSMLGMEK